MRNKIFRLFVLFSLVIFTFCFLNCEKEEQPVLEFDKETFYEQWAAWEAQGIKDYSVTIKWEVHSPFPYSYFYRLTVRENTLFQLESLDGYNYGNSINMPTISTHFSAIENIFKECKNSLGYIRLTYNMDYHYPEIIDFCLPEGEGNGRGSETRYLLEFTPLTSETENNK